MRLTLLRGHFHSIITINIIKRSERIQLVTLLIKVNLQYQRRWSKVRLFKNVVGVALLLHYVTVHGASGTRHKSGIGTYGQWTSAWSVVMLQSSMNGFE